MGKAMIVPFRIHTQVEAKMSAVSAAFYRLQRYANSVESSAMRTKALNELQSLDDALDELEEALNNAN